MGQYGPYGTEDGIPFSFPAPVGSYIVGFYGRTLHSHINALGVYVKEYRTLVAIMPNTKGEIITIGPAGGWGGSSFTLRYEPDQSLRITVYVTSDYISRLSFEYVSVKGEKSTWDSTTWSSPNTPKEINIGNGEYITSIEGSYSSVRSISYKSFLRSLGFTTNRQKYGPFGSDSLGVPFSIPVVDGKIVGFFGRYDPSCIFNIGVYALPNNLLTPERGNSPSAPDQPPGMNLNKEGEMIMVGPWGGTDGADWELEDSIRILEIRLRHGNAIDSISFQYESNSKKHWSPYWGGRGGQPGEFLLKPNEFLTSISGHFGNYKGEVVVRSLTFTSNTEECYGPFGKEEGTSFSLPIAKGKILSFYGLAGDYLVAIGAILGA